MFKLFRNFHIGQCQVRAFFPINTIPKYNFNNNIIKKHFFKKTNCLLQKQKDFYSKYLKLIYFFLETLGVPKTADQNEIKKAYFKLAKEWHPDVNKSANAKEKFSELSE